MALPLAACALSSCATVPLATQIDTANNAVTIVLVDTDNAYKAGLITKAQAEAVNTITHQVNPLLDSAAAAVAANDPTSASKTLNLVNSLLAGLNAYVPPKTGAK